MPQVRYTLNPVLSVEQLETIVEDGLCLLAEIGIECKHAGIQEIVARRAGASVTGDRLHFPTNLCREHIEKIRAIVRRSRTSSHEQAQEPENDAEEPIHLKAVGPWTCINVIDIDTQEVRLGTLRDLVDATKLCVALGVEGRKVCAPVCANDVPEHLQCLAMAKEAWKYCDGTGGGVARTVSEVECLWELGHLAQVQPPYSYVEFGISPLTFNAEALDLVYKLLGREELKALEFEAGPIPTMGGTGPLHFKALMSQSVAETVGGSLLVDLLTQGERTPVCSAMTAIATDLRYGTSNFSSPEAVMLLQMGFEVGSYLTGVRGVGGAVRTIGKGPNAQAASEKMMCALIGALSGATHFCDVGQMSVDDLFSLEQVVIDMEILACVERFVNGFAFEPGDTVEILREGLESRNFFTHPLTLKNSRSYYWYPQVFERRMLGSWQAGGGLSTEAKARAIAREKIAAQPRRVDDDLAAKMDALFERAAADLGYTR